MSDDLACEWMRHSLGQYCEGYSSGLDDNPAWGLGIHHHRQRPERPTPSWLDGYDDGIHEEATP